MTLLCEKGFWIIVVKSFMEKYFILLKFGCHDNDIISILINIYININQHDDFEKNTGLYNLILKKKEKNIIVLIDIENANFMLKNKNDKWALKLLTQK